jgi:glycosyltransferase involved in cell wall biosynthesis
LPESHRTGPRSISAIIPVFNEVESVEHGVRAVVEFLARHGFDHEIVLIESGSTDGTYELCDKLAVDLQNINVIHEGRRNGFGAAMMLGFRTATKDLLWTVPVDLPFPLESLLTAMPLISDHDAVISYRSRDRRSALRRAQSVAYKVACRLVLGLRVRGVNSAFKLLRRELVARVSVEARGWSFDAELLYRMAGLGARIAEIPVALLDRTAGKSTVKSIDALRTLGELIALRLKN